MNIRIKFNAAQDILDFSDTLIKSSPSKHASELAKHLLVDSLGDTYFIPDIASLSEKDAQESDIYFRINNENIKQEIKLHEVWLQIRNNNIQALNLVYNHTLARALLRINKNKNEALLDHGIPVFLVDPVIAISGADHHFHSYHDIRTALQRVKKDHMQSSYGVETGVNINDKNKQHLLLNNHALQQLLNVYIEQCKTVSGDVKHKASNDINQYKTALAKQDAYWKKKEEHCATKKGSFATLSSSDLEQLIVNINEEIKQGEEACRSARYKASKVIAGVGYGMMALGVIVGVAATAAMFVTPIGYITLGLLAVVGVAFLGGLMGLAMKVTAYKPYQSSEFSRSISTYVTADADKNLQALNAKKSEYESEIQRRSTLPPNYINEKVTRERTIQEKRQQIREKVENLQPQKTSIAGHTLWTDTRYDRNNQRPINATLIDVQNDPAEKTPLLRRGN